MSGRERQERLDQLGAIPPAATGDLAADPRREAAMRRRNIERKATREGAERDVRVPEGSGAPLPDGLASRMGEKLGADFSDVRVHTNGDSADAAHRLGAKAFAVDKNVHFGAGQFSPSSKEGQHLIAHELAHVAQGKAGTVQHKREVSRPDDPAELEADSAADRVIAGERAPVGGAQRSARVHLNHDKDKKPAAEAGKDGAHAAPDAGAHGPDAGAHGPDASAPGADAGAHGGAHDDKHEKAGGDKAAEKTGGSPDGDAAHGHEEKGAPKPAAGPASYASLAELAASLTSANVATWAANPEICLAILKGPFESNWFKAKECLLMNKWPPSAGAAPDHAAAMALMDGLTKMRGMECEKVQKRAEKEIQLEVQKEAQKVHGLDDPMSNPGVTGKLGKEGEVGNDKSTGADGKEKPGKQVEFKAPVGNQKRTSDIDTATGGMNTELAVALFNRLFKEMLSVPYESGTLFDYNVYAMDWIHNLKFEKGKAPGAGGAEKDVTTKITPGTEHELPNQADKSERNLVMEKASILHIRRFMDDKEWKDYCKGRVDKAEEKERAPLLMMLDEVDVQHTEFNAEIGERSKAIDKEIQKALGAHESAWGEHNKHFADEASKTRASNRIYEERLREVKALRVQYQVLAEVPAPERKPDHAQQLADLAKQVSKVLSEALFFANEVYASEGATVHVVLGMQGANKKNEEQKDTGVKVDVPITPEQYMQSFNENVGDVLKDLGHFKENPSFAVYRAGKYMDRMCKAATAMTPAAKDHALFGKLTEIAAKSVTVKESAKGDDPLQSIAEFREWNPGMMATLREQVIQFGSDIPSQAQAAQAKSAEVATGSSPAPHASGSASTEAPKSGGSDAAASNPLLAKAKDAQAELDPMVTQMETGAADKTAAK